MKRMKEDVTVFHLKPVAAAVMIAASGSALAQTDSATDEARVLEEIVVTATRREQSVQEIPYNISAISGAQLESTSLSNASDLLLQIPGVFVPIISGGLDNLVNNISIRGINANNPSSGGIQNITDPSVTTYIGDTPLFWNIKLTDVSRVELLRGPQGTLYGSGSVGGTVRYIFNDPDPEEFSAKINVQTSVTNDSDESNYSGDIMINVPLSDSWAARFVGGFEELGGFIDSAGLWVRDSGRLQSGPHRGNGPATPSGDYLTSGPILHGLVEDTDDDSSWYARASIKGDLGDNTTATLTYIHQEDTNGNRSTRHIEDVATTSGPRNLEFDQALGEGESTVDLVSLELSVDLGFATLTSSTAYTRSEYERNESISGLYQSLDDCCGLYFGYPRILANSFISEKDDVFTQEFRLVSQGDSSVDWIVGGFYKSQEKQGGFIEEIFGYDDWLIAAGFPEWSVSQGLSMDPAYIDIPFEFQRTIDYEDIAVFGEVTYHLSDRWQITGGARFFWQDFSQDQRTRFPYCSFFCASDGVDLLGTTSLTIQQDFQDSLFKLNTSYKLSDDAMFYLTVSEGFRHGGANGLPTTGPLAVDPSLLQFDSDSVLNFETGLKGYLADGRVSYTAAYFRADWDDVQLDTFVGPLATPAAVNGNSALSQGIELELTARVNDNLDINFGYAYTDAELTEDAVLGDRPVFDGDPLPGVSEHAFSIFANYLVPLSSGNEILFHLDGSYRSDFETTFNSAHPNYSDLSGFKVVNATVNWRSEKLTVGLFANNLTDEEGITSTTFVSPPARANIMRPRTYGISLTYDF